MADPGISGGGVGGGEEWDGGEEEGTLAIETVLLLPIPTLTFLHPIPGETWEQTEKEVFGS